MNKVGQLTIAAVLGLVVASGIASAQTTTLNSVKQRGTLSCGVNNNLAGFSQSDDKGNWTGLDVDYCKAIAAAVLGDATKVKYVSTTAKDRFNALRSGEIDVLVRNTSWSLDRESSLGVIFAGVNYYDGQGVMVQAARGFKSVKDLDGAAVCVGIATTSEAHLADYFKANKLSYKPLVFEQLDETVQAYLAGRCDAVTTDQSGLYAARIQQPKPRDHVVLPEIVSKEPLGPSVRQGDDQWLTIVRWAHFVLINAEELGITRANVDQMAFSTDPDILRFFGKDGDLGKGLGLENDFAANIVKAVGNYGEVFERNVGSGSRLKIARGLNNLWNKGGIQYAPPFR